MISLAISNIDDSIRVDQFLSDRFDNLSRSKIQKLIQDNSILVNGESVKKKYLLQIGDKITLEEKILNQTFKEIIPWDYPLEILYQDEDLAIINKPKGIVVHPTTVNQDHTLVNILLGHFDKKIDQSIDSLRPGIVHRLDKDTTGIMIIPFTSYAHWKIAEQFKNREVKKEYLAITWGLWNEKEGLINDYIIRNRSNPKQFISTSLKRGKNATTNFELVKNGQYLSLIKFFPTTGRTHQIRVHSKSKGHIIFGDDLYGGGLSKAREYSKEIADKMIEYASPVAGHFLHAASISFFHPVQNRTMTFSVNPDDQFQKLQNDILSEAV